MAWRTDKTYAISARRGRTRRLAVCTLLTVFVSVVSSELFYKQMILVLLARQVTFVMGVVMLYVILGIFSPQQRISACIALWDRLHQEAVSKYRPVHVMLGSMGKLFLAETKSADRVRKMLIAITDQYSNATGVTQKQTKIQALVHCVHTVLHKRTATHSFWSALNGLIKATKSVTSKVATRQNVFTL